MKNLSFVFILMFIGQFCFAQNINKIDSLKLELNQATNDTTRVLIYEKLMNNSRSYNMKIEFGLIGFELARRIHYDKGIILLGNQVAQSIVNNGDFYKAIPIAMITKQATERTNDKIGLASALWNLGYAYGKFDSQKSFNYYMQCKNLIEKEGISEDIIPISLMIGLRYKDEGKQLDSALYYLNKSYQLSLKSKSYLYKTSNHFRHFGDVYYQLGQVDLALKYLRQAIESNDNSTDYIYLYMAYIFRDRNQLDSSKFYAKKSLPVEQIDRPSKNDIQSATLLFELYRNENPAEALHYHLKATEYKDSVFNQIKVREIDKLVFEEKEKEAEIQRRIEATQIDLQNRLRMNTFLGSTFTLIVIAIFLFILNRRKQKANIQLKSQKEKVENTLDQLKATQSQLIQSEKMASLGELTAGIAHEIQNPLNFVNNFSEVSNELIHEMKEELVTGNLQLATELADDVIQNLEKINHHGKRAADIVKGMLAHSRTSSGQKEPTDINALADEYLRLAYHGLRAKDKTFNADFKTEFDESLPKINVIPQDIGRVLLNLINNAFYAVDKRARSNDPLTPKGELKNDQNIYRPTVTVSITSSKSPSGDLGVRVVVKDNGDGIPPHIVDKIFQPFFTTKPTGQGTGLGLSLSYDIVKAHGGELKVNTKPARAGSDGENEGTEFTIILPA